MKQIPLTALVSFAVLALLAIGGFTVIQTDSSSKEESPSPAIEKSAAQPVNRPAPQEEFAGSLSTPTTLSDGMSEFAVQLYLHEMTHNKVYANVKFGSRPLTAEGIAKLKAIVEKNDYKDEKFYLETLSAWESGNFSNAVHVHNTIWTWHGGNIGKAPRMMTEQEQQTYVAEYH